MKPILYLILIVLSFASRIESSCKHPPPSSNFTLDAYYGVWYEAGRIQTAGGAAFQKDCVCTSIVVSPKADATSASGDSEAINSCRKNTPEGVFINATGHLTEMNPPGKWKEQFFSFAPKVDYTVIYVDDQFAIEYDCGVFAGLITNYCIHVMSRSPNPDPEKVRSLVNFAEGLGLNTEKLTFQKTPQENCWNKYK